jgi:hypothetical protein
VAQLVESPRASYKKKLCPAKNKKKEKFGFTSHQTCLTFLKMFGSREKDVKNAQKNKKRQKVEGESLWTCEPGAIKTRDSGDGAGAEGSGGGSHYPLF